MAEELNRDRRAERLRRKKQRQRQLYFRLGLLAAAALVLLVLLIAGIVTLVGVLTGGDPEGTEPPVISSEPSDPGPTEPYVVSAATVGAMGDLLMHKPVFDDLSQYNSAVQSADGSYDFTCVFEHLMDYTSELDYAVANLETTFGGDEFPYQGNPSFNCPDALMDTLVECGYDMLLTANNHCADTLMTGIDRTLEVVRGYDVQTLGTRLSGDEPRFVVEDINGIRVGMVCYTYTLSMVDSKPNLNGNTPVDNPEQVNFFDYQNLNRFYGEMEQILAQMLDQGAEATIVYIHWGDEYKLKQNERQSAIAQKLCDMGVDVIIGGHPHVVQPIELLQSDTDPDHRTVCAYSLGNVVSNQRLGNLKAIDTAHTEDGMIFQVSFEKYSDGTVYVSAVEVVPTWVRMYNNENGKTVYAILPLENARRQEWGTMFGITGNTLTAAGNSYDRTMQIVGEGLQTCQTYLIQAKTARDQAIHE